MDAKKEDARLLPTGMEQSRMLAKSCDFKTGKMKSARAKYPHLAAMQSTEFVYVSITSKMDQR